MTLWCSRRRARLLAGDLKEGTVPMANQIGPIDGSTGGRVTGVLLISRARICATTRHHAEERCDDRERDCAERDSRKTEILLEGGKGLKSENEEIDVLSHRCVGVQ
jgi:hypothetical protein